MVKVLIKRLRAVEKDIPKHFFFYPYLLNIQKQITMGHHHPGRLAAVVVSVVGYVISLVFNALAVVGIGK